MRLKFLVILFIFGLNPFSGATPLKVVTSTTDLAWAVKEIGGSLVEVQSLLKGNENPHYSDAVPEFVRLVADAKVVCVVGLDLEVGWMPKVLTRSGNSKVQPGGSGYCEAGKGIQVLEKVQGATDRSMGDIHPAGNPHFWLSPTHFAQGAQQITKSLIDADPAHVTDYQAGLKNFQKQMESIQAKNAAKIKPFLSITAGPVLIEYHKEFAYFLEAYGLKSIGSIEEKPGVAPSAGRLAEVSVTAKASKIRFVLAAETAPKKTLDRFAELAGVPVVNVPMSLQPSGKFKQYAEFQDHLVDSVVKHLSTPPG